MITYVLFALGFIILVFGAKFLVDGASSYTEMLSYHAFDLIGEYPKSEQKTGYYSNITYSDVYFLEPETRSDQSLMVSIVKTEEYMGYYA